MSQNKKIYVGNLAFQSAEKDLETLFEQFGAMEEINLITDRDTGRSKGFAFIKFEEVQSAQDALKLDGSEFQGRNIRVNLANEERRRSSGGRPDRGDRGGRRSHG